MDDILKILQKDGRASLEDIARQVDKTEAEVSTAIDAYVESGAIRGFQAIINEDIAKSETVTAVIEVSLQPEREGGFNRTADRVSKFSEVFSVFLVSGNYDLLLFISGDTLQEVASFVSDKLSTIPGVTSTATHFMLKTYKHRGVLMQKDEPDERIQVSP